LVAERDAKQDFFVDNNNNKRYEKKIYVRKA
jgi:hypothetical protein